MVIATNRVVRFETVLTIGPDNPLTDAQLREVLFAMRNLLMVQLAGAMNVVPVILPRPQLEEIIRIEHTAPGVLPS